ncbi:hypothetical protein [Rhizobium sp. CECT 9324]|uniref:hypothetical protein n=1 Tax=Rhizobium sp. CECT 9324 TaxID=2845820 RepID=UPI001E2B7738|nr:hypothetical protein [Rhizobium sp. CECT 9324]CAH0338388.1 hypothetical protein RHI9324_00009 [Rhizobium sp. CECT 9324]CAH0343750.1 hypothetical protein RHI9324_05487 [Rhizobium sp. CECT 9324]
MIKAAAFTIFIVSPLGHVEPLTQRPDQYNRFTTEEACQEAKVLVKDALKQEQMNLHLACLPSSFQRD